MGFVWVSLQIVDDPRAATMPFFRSIRADDDRARKGFEADMNGVIDKIRARAAQKKAQGESMPSAAGGATATTNNKTENESANKTGNK